MTVLVLFLASGSPPATEWEAPVVIFLKLFTILFLVLLNGFFVASEFAIVKVRGSQLNALGEDAKFRVTWSVISMPIFPARSSGSRSPALDWAGSASRC